MPLLTSAQRLQFTRFPKPDERMLARNYLLTEGDLTQVMHRRRDFNRVGYAAQLTVLKRLCCLNLARGRRRAGVA